MNPDNGFKRAGFSFVLYLNVFSNNENGAGAPKDEGGLSPDNDEVVALYLIRHTNVPEAFYDIGG